MVDLHGDVVSHDRGCWWLARRDNHHSIVAYTIRHGHQSASAGSSVRLEYTYPKVICRYGIFGRKCYRPGDKVTVGVVVDFRDAADGKTFGLVTACCLMPNKDDPCPSWLNRPV